MKRLLSTLSKKKLPKMDSPLVTPLTPNRLRRMLSKRWRRSIDQDILEPEVDEFKERSQVIIDQPRSSEFEERGQSIALNSPHQDNILKVLTLEDLNNGLKSFTSSKESPKDLFSTMMYN